MQGRITGFSGSWGSGIATLYIDGMPIHCENAATVRALDACFDCIGENHTVCPGKLIGQEIEYTVDELGLLLGFSPLEEGE